MKYIVGDGFVENKIDKFSYSVSDGDAVVTGQVYVLLEDLMKPEEVFIQTQVIFFFGKPMNTNDRINGVGRHNDHYCIGCCFIDRRVTRSCN